MRSEDRKEVPPPLRGRWPGHGPVGGTKATQPLGDRCSGLPWTRLHDGQSKVTVRFVPPHPNPPPRGGREQLSPFVNRLIHQHSPGGGGWRERAYVTRGRQEGRWASWAAIAASWRRVSATSSQPLSRHSRENGSSSNRSS